MSETELQALIDLLRRVPMTPAEQLWTQALIMRLAAEIKAKAKQTDANLG